MYSHRFAVFLFQDEREMHEQYSVKEGFHVCSTYKFIHLQRCRTRIEGLYWLIGKDLC